MPGSMNALGWNATAHRHVGEGRDPEWHAHLRLLRKPLIGSLSLVRNHPGGINIQITSWPFGEYADGTVIASKPIFTSLLSN